MVQVNGRVVEEVQRARPEEPQKQVKVFAAPSFVSLIHAADGIEDIAAHPDTAARWAADQESAQYLWIESPRAEDATAPYCPGGGNII